MVTSNNFKEKLQRNPEKSLKMGNLENLSRGASKLNPEQEKIFFTN